jgi:hypothetical protein
MRRGAGRALIPAAVLVVGAAASAFDGATLEFRDRSSVELRVLVEPAVTELYGL